MAESFETAERIVDFKEYQSEDFRTEKELCDYINSHIKEFCTDVLEIEYIDHEREYCISHDRRINQNHKARVDFKFTTPFGDVYVECKKPSHLYSESNQSISQILAYSCIADFYKRDVSRLVLVTTRYSAILGAVIRKYNLPIEVYVFSKNKVLKMLPNE
jgi:hypothetical protein